MTRSRRAGRARCALALAVALVGCDDGGRSPSSRGEPQPSPMVAELARIATEVMPDNRFLGHVDRDRLQQQLDGLPPSATPRVRFDLLTKLASHELRLGRVDDALELLARAETQLADMPAETAERSRPVLLYQQGLSALRLAENRNCVDCAGPESCLVPFRGDAIHADTTGSRLAIDRLTRLLEHPRRGRRVERTAQWLLNIAAMTLGEHPDSVPEAWLVPPEVLAGGEPFPRFPNVSATAGTDSFNLSGGAVVEDLDGDGLLDVLTSTWHYEGPMRLLLNAGDGTFRDATADAGLEGLTGGLNMIHGDVDDDGDDDVLVLRGAWFGDLGRHPNSLLLNDGKGHFTDMTHAAGLAEPAYPTQAAGFADYDGDGDLDLYVGNEDTSDVYHPSQLFRQDDALEFTDVARDAGVENHRYAKGVAWGDYDDDGDPDLYVSNFMDDNRLFRNDGDAGFTDVAPTLGVEEPIQSFPCWFWDYDNDGVLDLYVAAYVEDMGEVAASWMGQEHEQPSGRLYRGDGRGGFTDVSDEVGLSRLVTTMGANFGDLDDDGWLDFYLGTGFPSYAAMIPNVMYRSVGGERFADVSSTGGFSHLQKGHAVAFADLDDDGDQDVFEQMGGAYTGDSYHDALYRNPGTGNASIRLRLEGTLSARSAFGARIRADVVEDGVRRSVHRVVGTGGSFGSSPLAVHVGLGDVTAIERLEVQWPASGRRHVFQDVAVGRAYTLREDEDVLREQPFRRLPLGD